MLQLKFQDLEKVLKVFQEKVPCSSFCSIQSNPQGNFIIYVDELDTYVVDRHDLTIWKVIKDGVRIKWEEIK